MKKETENDIKIKILVRKELPLKARQVPVVSYFMALDSKGKGMENLDPMWMVRLRNHLNERTQKEYGIPFTDQLLVDLMRLNELKDVCTFNDGYVLENENLFIVNILDLSLTYYDEELTSKDKEEDILRKVVSIGTTNTLILNKICGKFSFCNNSVTPYVIGDFVLSALPFYKSAYKKLFGE